ncbi:MAG: S41 family peptidase [Spirochaetales bacterium]|nr:S41 family peptidase [Spirochaetales bacterium]
MNFKSGKLRERLLIIGITSFFITLLILLAFSPKVFAQSKDPETEDQILLLYEVLEFIKENYVDEEKAQTDILIKGALKGMLEALDDPYSMYLAEDDMSDMEETTTGKFGGVGLYILKGDKGVEVARPIPGTPAFRGGIVAGDFIIAVDEESVLELTIDEVVKRLKGPAGTKVTMTILRGESKTFDVTVERAMIELPTVKQAMIKNKIGYMEILQFTPITYERVVDAIEYFKKEKYNSLIIDVRSNPGGLLSSVIDITDLFFKPGDIIVSTRSRNPFDDRVYRAKEEPIVDPDFPIVVLIDKYSASAAEILTGALKDTHRAYIIGQTSYGKGSVQQVRYAGEGGFRLTVAKYYTPSDISIHGVGIEPDLKVEKDKPSKEEEASLEDLLESNAVELFIKNNPQPDEKAIKGFIQKLRKDGIIVKDRYIKKMIRNELNKTNNNPPVYDLDFDLELQEAVKYLEQKKQKIGSN